MFSNCTSLSSISVNFTYWGDDYTTNQWVSTVAHQGTFYKPSGLVEINGISYIPSGWTVVNK